MPNITITEFRGLAVDRHGARLTYPQLPPLAQQVLVIGASSQLSNTFAPLTRLVSLYADAVCRVAIGDAPDALATGFVLPANVERTFHVAGGARLAVLDGLPLATPLFSAAAVLNANTAGNAVTWSPATVPAGSPTPTIAYSLRKNGVEVATTSGSYSAASGGDVLTLITTATSSTGAKSTLTSDPVTVTIAAPSISVPPVLSAVIAGGAINFTAGTFVGTPTYSLMRGVTVLAANITSGQVVAGTVADDQVFVRLVASSSGQTPAQRDSNTAVVTAANADALMAASHRMVFYGGSTSIIASQVDMIAAQVHYSPDYAQYGYVLAFTGYFIGNTTNAETNFANAQTYRGVSMELDGVRYPFKTADGQTSFTVPPGERVLLYLDSSVYVPANKAWRQVVCHTGAVSSVRPSGTVLTNSLVPGPEGLTDGLLMSASDLSSYLVSGTIPAITYSRWPVPMANVIVAHGHSAANAVSKRAVAGLTGDSITEGSNDTENGGAIPDGVQGHAQRGLSDRTSSKFIPHFTIARYGTVFFGPGQSGANITAFNKRRDLLAELGWPCTTWDSALGTNTNASTVVAQCASFAAYLKTLYPAGGIPRRVIQQCLLPAKSVATVANLAFTTVENQKRFDTTPQVLNAQLRLGAIANIDAYLDVQGIVDANRTVDDYAWKPGTSGTLAATYAGNFGTTLILNVAPTIGEKLVVGAGTAAYAATGPVLTVSAAGVPAAGQYTVTVQTGAAGATQAAGTAVAGERSIDGVHPGSQAALEVAVGAYIPAKNADLFINPLM